jgi:hypothetical protein
MPALPSPMVGSVSAIVRQTAASVSANEMAIYCASGGLLLCAATYNIAVAWLAARDEDALAEEPWWGKGANLTEPLCDKPDPRPCDNPCRAMSEMFLLPPKWKPKPAG